VFKGRRLRVLVVDDNGLLRLAIGQALESRGCEIVGEAANGDEAAGKIEALRPDVVLLDLRMPDSSGFDLMHRMTYASWQTPVVVFSADHSPETRRRLLSYGANCVLPKGVPLHRLVQELEIAARAG
jgi:DNA-binding NarL/FixJ family response regulator